MTQGQRIIQYIEDFGSITSMQAYMDLGVTQLATRIKELSDSGVEFERETIKSTNRYGDPVHFTKYSLKKKETPTVKEYADGSWRLF